MARDKGLEELLNGDLQGVAGLTQKAMFGGWAWLMRGNLLCAARTAGMLMRLGREQEVWALEIPGVMAMFMRERRMHGWVRASERVYGDDALRRKLLNAALEFNRTLPAK